MRKYSGAWIAAAAAVLLSAGALNFLVDEPAEARNEPREGMGGSVWGADYFPNVPLTTHDGRQVRFFDDLIEGKVVAVNFIYTTCPDACPMETARMQDVHRLLGNRVGDDVHFYSITIDPERDTQEVLASYVETWGIGEGWTFLTGREEDITLLRKKLGVYSESDPGEDELDHNLSLVIGNQSSGRWMKRSPYENPYVLATQLGSWLHNWKLASTEKRDFADAPELRQITTGESLFRTRCASCHTIGGGDVAMDRGRIGPDLLNVTDQRDPGWLARWLKEPDVMLEEKDPLAMALYAQYKNVPMPNLRLTDVDVEHLMGYMENESRRIARARESDARMARRGDHHGAHHAGHAEAHGDGHHTEDGAGHHAGHHEAHGSP